MAKGLDLIFLVIATLVLTVLWYPIAAIGAVCYALFHDAEEAYSGDIATHVKVKLRDAGVDIDAIFAHDDEAPDYIRKIIKAADMMDAFIFIQPHGVGPRAADALTYNTIRWNEFAKSSPCSVVRKAAIEVYNKIMNRGEFL
jgi:hypothetical protein